jgi:hypothetical protein
MGEQKENSNTIELKKRLINSSAISSLRQELSIYEKFIQLDWNVEHSPFYADSNTGKYREVDISARKFWAKTGKKKFSFGVNFVVECKSIDNYHIVLCNEQNADDSLENDWVGQDGFNNYPETIKLLQKHNVRDIDIQRILKSIHSELFPKGIVRYYTYSLNSFKIPTFCSFRETNIGSTKDLENSVVWKAYQSLYSVIRTRQADKFKYIDYELLTIENEGALSSYEMKLKALEEALISSADHFEIFHPVLVVESKLWNLKSNSIKEMKYCRLVFQEMSGFTTWLDIVDYNYLDEYLAKSKAYENFFIRKGFKNSF